MTDDEIWDMTFDEAVALAERMHDREEDGWAGDTTGYEDVDFG